LPEAARVALGSVTGALAAFPALQEARFWLFDQRAFAVFSNML
jgi:hypothetical protein